MFSAKIKEQKLSKYIKTVPFFLFSEGQMHQNQSVLFSLLCCKFVETIFKMKINTHVTQYTATLSFNFVHTINP